MEPRTSGRGGGAFSTFQSAIGGARFLALSWLALVVWAIAVALLWSAHGEVLTWDEVDYVNAAQLGAWANALDTGSLTPLQFGRFALSKLSRQEPVLPAGYDERRDPFLLRHFHPPLVVFLTSAVSRSRNERVIRSVQLLGALALICAVVFGYGSISVSAGWWGALVVSLLGLWMSRALFDLLSFHGWMAVWATAGAALLSRWLDGNARVRSGLLVCAALALSLLTLETGLLVCGAALLSIVIWWNPGSGRKGFPWRTVVVGAAVTTLMVVAVWPGSVVKASILKAPAMYLYRIWLGEEYAAVGDRIPAIVRSLLPMIVLGPISYLWLLLVHRDRLRQWGPFALMAGVYGAAMAPFVLGPQYLLPAMVPLACIVGVAVDRLPDRCRPISALTVSLFLVVTLWLAWPAGAEDRGSRRADLDWLRHGLRGREALVDGGHIYRHYLGSAYAITSITVSYRGDVIAVREGGSYRALRVRDIKGKVVIIQKDRASFFGGPSEQALLAGCPRIDRFTIVVYDCAGRVVQPLPGQPASVESQ